jgi:hypothetical protein
MHNKKFSFSKKSIPLLLLLFLLPLYSQRKVHIIVAVLLFLLAQIKIKIIENGNESALCTPYRAH